MSCVRFCMLGIVYTVVVQCVLCFVWCCLLFCVCCGIVCDVWPIVGQLLTDVPLNIVLHYTVLIYNSVRRTTLN